MALHDQRLRGAPLPFAAVAVEAKLLQPADYSSDDERFGKENDGDGVASSDSESDADSFSPPRGCGGAPAGAVRAPLRKTGTWRRPTLPCRRRRSGRACWGTMP